MQFPLHVPPEVAAQLLGGVYAFVNDFPFAHTIHLLASLFIEQSQQSEWQVVLLFIEQLEGSRVTEDANEKPVAHSMQEAGSSNRMH